MSPDAQTALVTGATGFIGRVLAARLRDSGRRVVALTRKRPSPVLPGVEWVHADLASGEGVTPRLFEGVSHVFHCAGELRNAAGMRALHVGGTARLLEAMVKTSSAAPIRWVQLSSVGAYGPPPHPGAARIVDERSPEMPAGPYETTKTEADRLVRQAATDGLISCAVLRPSAVIGKGMSNASLPALISLVRRGAFVHVGSRDAVANYVHVDDVVDGLMRCGADSRAGGRTFNLSSDCLWSALIDRVAALSGVRPPRLRVPHSLARGVARVAAAVPGLPVTPARVDILAGRTSYPSTHIESVLGFRFTRPMPEAVADVMAARS